MARRTRPIVVNKNVPTREDRSWDVLNCLNAIERSMSRLEILISGDIERRGWEAMGHAYNEFINIRSVAECNELAATIEAISLADKLMNILEEYSSSQWERPSVHMYADDCPHREALIFLLSSFVACGKTQAGLFSHVRDLTNGKADVRDIDTAVQGIADHFDRHITKIMQAEYDKDRNNKVPAIKILRTVFGTGLRETKEMVDNFWKTKITSES